MTDQEVLEQYKAREAAGLLPPEVVQGISAMIATKCPNNMVMNSVRFHFIDEARAIGYN